VAGADDTGAADDPDAAEAGADGFSPPPHPARTSPRANSVDAWLRACLMEGSPFVAVIVLQKLARAW
jgi:hypothetical protein